MKRVFVLRRVSGFEMHYEFYTGVEYLWTPHILTAFWYPTQEQAYADKKLVGGVLVKCKVNIHYE